MVMYETKSGDTWDKIAYEQMGDCKHLAELLNCNREQLQVFEFSAGVKLQLPEVDNSPKLQLPAWW